ncbi:t-SNARE [Aulographum hederae CBS 113979]|uniref:t-SNARE n=1 Tax=Aulographum hederae CBS 113979 TaxID=1176131 RepID=A0A6G1GQ28_9PEZI|nr:t-SNARE [Aulographum hederae CBS 113979]
MWRDRTNLFISYRQSYSHHPAKKTKYSGHASNGFGDNSTLSEETRGLMSAGAFEDDGDAVIEMDLLPPRWLDIQDVVTEHLEEVTRQTKQLDQLHQKHVLPGFDDEDVKKKEEREIEQLTQEITRQFQSCQKAIKRIESMVRESKDQGGISRGEETMAQNLKISLATRVGEVSALFRKKQATYLKKLRQINGFASPLDRSSTPLAGNPYSDPSLMESESDRQISQSTLAQTASHRLAHKPGINDAAIAQREREIEDIAQGIISLANIFQELQTMVIDQGSMLDRIDYNVERMTVEVKEADKELTVATGYQKKGIKRKIILFLLLLVVGMIILLSLKLGTRGGEGSSTPIIPPPATPQSPPEGNAPAGGPPRERRREDTSLLLSVPVRKRKEWRRRRRRDGDEDHHFEHLHVW